MATYLRVYEVVVFVLHSILFAFHQRLLNFFFWLLVYCDCWYIGTIFKAIALLLSETDDDEETDAENELECQLDD